jgi:Phage virion morphogenesis family
MANRIRLEFWGDVQLDRTLADIDDRVSDMRPVWDVLADRFAALESRQFATEGAFGSGGWAALSPRYAAWKATHYPGQTILRREDDLFLSLTERPFGIEVLEPGFMIVGSDVEHGAYHQRGDGVPQRRPVEFPETERVEWLRAIQRFLMTGQAV